MLRSAIFVVVLRQSTSTGIAHVYLRKVIVVESYTREQVRSFARRERDGLPLDSWQRQALNTAKSQAGSEGAKLQRIIDGKED